jgi:hypothetical protein
MEKTTNLYSLTLKEYKSYLFATLFVAGNIALPQLCHLIPNGGLIILPIYFFTLVAAYKFGWRVGIMCGIASPLINHLLFGMPGAEMLSIIMVKSTILAIAASAIAQKTKSVSLALLTLAVLSYQIFGTLIEWAMVQDFYVAIQDFRLGLPGMALQVIGGYLILKNWKR